MANRIHAQDRPKPHLLSAIEANRASFRADPALLPTQYPTTLVAMAPSVPSSTFKTGSAPGGIARVNAIATTVPNVSNTTMLTTGAPQAIALPCPDN